MNPVRHILGPGVALALLTVACGDDDPNIAETGTPPGQSSPPPADGGPTIVADEIAFDVTTLEATVGAALTITFDNRDDGISHNLHVKGTAGGDAKTEIAEGPTTQTLEVTFEEPGEFEYFCDVHPQQMRGTITAAS